MRAIPGKTTLSVLCTLLLAGLLSSCAGPPRLKPVPDPSALALSCRGAYVIGGLADQPTRIRIANRTSSDLRIVLDQCDRQHQLGWVRAGTVVVLPLPSRLVEFSHGLRLHAYAVNDSTAARTFSVEPLGLIPDLVIRAGP